MSYRKVEEIALDYHALARDHQVAYLAEHPADDGISIDEQWLGSIGFDSRFWLLLEDDEITTTLALVSFAHINSHKAVLIQSGIDDDGEECETSVS